MRARGVIVVAAAALLLPAAASASPGDLDRDFGGDGLVRTREPAATSGSALALDRSGRPIVAGGTLPVDRGPSAMQVSRYRRDGRLDLSFGSRGRTRIRVGERPSYYDDASDVLALSGGRILVAGQTGYSDPDYNDYSLAFAQLERDGSLRPKFGDEGVATLRRPGEFLYPSTGLSRDERGGFTLIADSIGPAGLLVAKVTPRGRPAARFGTRGVAAVDANPVQVLDAAAARPGGGMVLAAINNRNDPVLLRTTPRGRFDDAFGVRAIPFHVNSRLGGVAVDDRGRTIVAGTTRSGPRRQLEVARLLPDGTVDESFGREGRTVIEVDRLGGSSVRAVRIDENGRILVGASAQVADHRSAFLLARLNRDGRLNRVFGKGGTTRAVLPDGGVTLGDLELGRDGTITAVGSTTGEVRDVVLARWLG